MGGLAEHVLLELTARMKSVAENVFKDDEIVEVKKSILTLMIAAGHDSAKAVDLDGSINDILSSFSVGTENRKKNTTGAPDPTKIGPISELENGSLVSNERKVAIKMGQVKDYGKNTETETVTNDIATICRDARGLYPVTTCECCDSGLTTRYRCQHKMTEGKVHDPLLGRICGRAFCCTCDVAETRTTCSLHVNQSPTDTSFPPDVEVLNETVTTDDNPVARRTAEMLTEENIDRSPDFLAMNLFLTEIGVDITKDEKIKTVGLKLVRLRSLVEMQKTLVDEGLPYINKLQRKVATQWLELIELTKERRRPKGLGGKKRKTEKEAQELVSPPSPMILRSQNTSAIEVKKKPNRKTPNAKKYCCFHGCRNNELTDGVTIHRLQKIPNELPTDASVKRTSTHIIKSKKRAMQVKSCGLKKGDATKDLRVCSQCCDNMDVKVLTTPFEFEGNVYKHSYVMPVIKSDGVKTRPVTDSKGTSTDRYALHTIRKLKEEIEKNEAMEWAKQCHQMTEQNTPNKDLPVNHAVAKEYNMKIENPTADTGIGPQKMSHARKSEPIMNDKRKRDDEEDDEKHAWEREPDVRLYLNGRGDKEVKRRTGFETELELLAVIVILCNGDSDTIKKTSSVLTWYEEFYFFFELLYGTIQTWEDAESEKHGFSLDRKSLRKVFDTKLAMAKASRDLWPRYAFHHEDRELCDPKYHESYKGHRPVFWDMTNIKIPKPTEANLQRLTYSSYYGMNCFKGGIGLQQCGWILTHDLWVGCASDTKYQEDGGIYEAQDKFAKADKVENDHLSFTNVLDKGYRTRLAAWRNGKQHTLQPEFAKSDSKFGRNKTLTSAKIAADRAANERAVRLTKMSGYLKRGLSRRQSFHRLGDAWLAWGFIINFMYASVV